MQDFLAIVPIYSIATIVTAVLCLMEIQNFFKERRVTLAQIFSHGPSISFVVGNGIIAAAILTWWGGYGPASDIAPTGIPGLDPTKIDNPYLLAIIVAFATPAIIRSRFIEWGTEDNKTAYGFEGIYTWFQRKVFADLGRVSGLKRKTVSIDLAKQFSDASYDAHIFDDLPVYVENFLADEKALDLQAKYQKEIDSEAAFESGDRQSGRYRQAVIRVSMEYAGVRAVQQYFKSI